MYAASVSGSCEQGESVFMYMCRPVYFGLADGGTCTCQTLEPFLTCTRMQIPKIRMYVRNVGNIFHMHTNAKTQDQNASPKRRQHFPHPHQCRDPTSACNSETSAVCGTSTRMQRPKSACVSVTPATFPKCTRIHVSPKRWQHLPHPRECKNPRTVSLFFSHDLC
jgi:hypothetical protein